jgi:hypothetical protein
MLNLDNIAQDYDKMDEIVRHDNDCMEERFVFYNGYNWYADKTTKRFDFAYEDYIFTIEQHGERKPFLHPYFSVTVGTDEIEFERS